MKNYDNVTIFNHPLIQHKIAILRDEKTSMKEFRELIEEITTLMTFECLREDVPTTEIKYVQNKEVIHLRGNVIPLIRLDEMLDVERNGVEPESLTVVIVANGDKLAGLVVDNLIGQQEIVIKSVGKFINNSKLISGATILGDGEVALILDANVLL